MKHEENIIHDCGSKSTVRIYRHKIYCRHNRLWIEFVFFSDGQME